MDSTAKLVLALAILLPLDYGAIMLINLLVLNIKNKMKNKIYNEGQVPEPQVDKDFWSDNFPSRIKRDI